MKNLKSYWPALAGIFIGGIAGSLYWYFIGCQSGTCPISGNPFASTAYGATMGYLASGLGHYRSKRHHHV
jgi:hypothetical protein